MNYQLNRVMDNGETYAAIGRYTALESAISSLRQYEHNDRVCRNQTNDKWYEIRPLKRMNKLLYSSKGFDGVPDFYAVLRQAKGLD